MVLRLAVLTAVLAHLPAAAAADWVSLFNGKDLGGWEVIGDGLWTVTDEGVLAGQRNTRSVNTLAWPLTQRVFNLWLHRQAWLYTRKDFGEFDLSLEFWAPHGANSGVSIRDTSRAKYAVSEPPDFNRTPSHVGYEIQINNGYPDPIPTGSIYRFVNATDVRLRPNGWNTLEIESRRGAIRVKLNGRKVAEHPGDPRRSLTGPIGLQLHDQFTWMMFRNIRIQEAGGGM